jgi:formylglycine-generating enzyme
MEMGTNSNYRFIFVAKCKNNNFMKLLYNYVSCLALVGVVLSGCGKAGGGTGRVPKDGQLHAVAPSKKYKLPKPPGMVYIPAGTFNMGPSDEDINYAQTARNRNITIPGFWMDATEITNNQYRMFTRKVIDSIMALAVGGQYVTKSADGEQRVNWKTVESGKGIVLNKQAIENSAGKILVSADERINGIKEEIDASKVIYQYSGFDYAEAARNPGKPRREYIKSYPIAIYPDTLVWIKTFTYSYNDPMAQRYYSHPSFGNYPVVGVTWKQANAFCNWRTNYLNTYLRSKKRSQESNFRLATEAEWEYAARGGRSQSMYPWGNYYPRNKKGCLLANFKPGRGDYAADGAVYTWRADASHANDFGLYNMAGNVAEWTISYFYEGSYNFVHDLSPDLRYDAKDDDPIRMKRKVVRGGSWKDVAFYIQTGTRSFEYQDSAKSYIGFRTVIDLPAR